MGGVVAPPFVHGELKVGEGHPIDLLRYQRVSPFFSVEVEIEREPAAVAEAVLPQRRATFERQVGHFVHAAVV